MIGKCSYSKNTHYVLYYCHWFINTFSIWFNTWFNTSFNVEQCNLKLKSFPSHPNLHHLNRLFRVAGVLELIPAVIGWKVTTIHAHIHAYGQFRVYVRGDSHHAAQEQTWEHSHQELGLRALLKGTTLALMREWTNAAFPNVPHRCLSCQSGDWTGHKLN